MLIGLSGVAQSGKDTVANYLVNNHGFRGYGFAEYLRELISNINPYVILDIEDQVHRLGVVVKLNTALEEFSYEDLKKNKQVRALYQNVGMGVRTTFGEEFWVTQLFDKISQEVGVANNDGIEFVKDVVISDVRFNNEAEIIKNFSGNVIKVDRGLPPVINPLFLVSKKIQHILYALIKLFESSGVSQSST